MKIGMDKRFLLFEAMMIVCAALVGIAYFHLQLSALELHESLLISIGGTIVVSSTVWLIMKPNSSSINWAAGLWWAHNLFAGIAIALMLWGDIAFLPFFLVVWAPVSLLPFILFGYMARRALKL